MKKKIELSVITSAVITILFNGCGNGSASSATPTPLPTPETKISSTIVGVDGYFVGSLGTPVTVEIEGKTHSSELILGKKGLITFKGVNVKKGTGVIKLSKKGVTIDANNNGKVDADDKPLKFDLSSPVGADVITPLTTLLVSLESEGKDVSAFKSLVLTFDPVAAANSVVTQTGITQLQTQKLMILMEVVKVSLSSVSPAELSGIDLNKVTTTSEGEKLEDFNVTALVASLPEAIKAKAEAKGKTIQAFLPILNALDPKKVDLATLMVAISDGEKTPQQALVQSSDELKEGMTLEEMIKEAIDASYSGSINIKNITNSLTIIQTNIISINSENYTIIIVPSFVLVEITPTPTETATTDTVTPTTDTVTPTLQTSNAKLSFGTTKVDVVNNVFDLNISHTINPDTFYDVTIGSISTNTAFSDTPVNFFAKITNTADDTDYVELEVIGAMVSSTGSSNFITKLSISTIIKLKEVKDGAVSTYQRAMKKTISDADLHFNLQDIVDNLDNSNITAGLDRMKGYLNVANRSYDVEMKITGLGNPSISGTINVQ